MGSRGRAFFGGVELFGGGEEEGKEPFLLDGEVFEEEEEEEAGAEVTSETKSDRRTNERQSKKKTLRRRIAAWNLGLVSPPERERVRRECNFAYLSYLCDVVNYCGGGTLMNDEAKMKGNGTRIFGVG